MSLRSIDWPGSPIVHACTAQASWGQLLLLTKDGALHGLDLDNGQSRQLAKLELSEPTAPTPYWPHGFKVHCALSGDHAVIADDGGTFGVLVNLRTGERAAQLFGGDYHPRTVPFSIAFSRHQGGDVLIHRTDWNRLDAMDCVTGQSLSARGELEFEQPHYLDYFHGRLLPSPSHEWLLDDGWVWAPVGIPTVWSLPAWLEGNRWESEDGPTRRHIAQGEGWNQPCVWLDDARIAIWNVGNWDDDGFADCMYAPGVVIFDIHVPRPDEGHSGQVWPMPDLPRAQHLHCVNGRLLVVGEGQSWLWDVSARRQLARWPDFAPQGWCEQHQQLLEWSAQQIKVMDARNAL